MCGCRVASVTKYKGDKAKKEFSIDNSVELNRIRDKYAEKLTTDDNRKILPSFFGHISKQKGYYDPKHKAYLQHDTSMDYLQNVVKRFRTKNRIKKPTSKLIDVFDVQKYREKHVNKKQISHIMKYVKWYSVEVGKLFAHDYYSDIEHITDTDETRYDKYIILRDRLVQYVGQYRIGYSTMIYIIKQLERKDYAKYKNILLPLLFTLCRESFLEAVIKSQEEIDVLVENGNDIKLFDFDYKMVKNYQFFTNFDQNSTQTE